MPRSLSGVVSALFRSRSDRGSAPQKRNQDPIARAARSAIEPLENRLLFAITTLTNGTGDGSLSITVDAYGAYGRSAAPADDANYNPVGSGGIDGSTYESGLYFSPIDNFLAQGDLSGTGGLAGVAFTTTTATVATSTFTLGGFTFLLTQTVQAIQDQGTTFVQQYRITNNSATSQSVRLVRHVDGDLNFIPGLDDFAGVTSDRNTVFEFDTATDPTAATGFFSISNTGGTNTGFTIQPYGGGYFDNIVAANGIPAGDLNRISQDADNNRLTDVGYDVTVTRQNDLTIGAGATANFTTITRFGQGSPADIIGTPQIQFATASITRSEASRQAIVTVTRRNGTGQAASVNYATIAGGTGVAGVDYTPVSGTLNFAAGESRLTFTVPILEDNVPDGDKTVFLQLTNPTNGAELAVPFNATLTITDDTPFIQFRDPSVTVLENTGVAVITLERSGSTQGEASIIFSATAGTATAGQDFTPVEQVVTFANGQRFATVEVPITQDFVIEPEETVSLGLRSATGAALGTPSLTTLTIENFETPPAVLDISTNGFNNKIVEFVITYSTDLNPENAIRQTNYDLFLRKEKRLGGSPSRDAIPLKSIVYDPTLHTVTIEPTKLLKANRFYEINVSGTRTGAVSAPGGTPLDGNFDASPGDDFRGYFGRGTNLTYFDAQGDRVGLKLLGGAGAMDVFRPANRDVANVKFYNTIDGISDLVGTFSPYPKFTDNKATISLVGGGGVLRDLDSRIVIDSDVP